MTQYTPPSGEPASPYSGTPEQQPRPVRVALPTTRPYVTYVIMGVTIAVYLLQLLSERLVGFDLLAAYGACVKPEILQGQLWRFLTPIVLHASVPHIAFNMYALWVFGLDLERLFGRWRYLLLYLVGGFAGNVLSFLFLPNSLQAGSVGASTAIFGLVAAEGVFLFQNRAILGRNYGRAISNVLIVVVGNLLLGLRPGIDNWGHAGGLVGGLIFTWLGGPLLEVQNTGLGLRLGDKREFRSVLVAAAVVVVLFGALALWGMLSTAAP